MYIIFSHETFDTTFPHPHHHLFFRFVNILLPPDAKEIATRFRWWQPRHDGLDQNDWAIDNVLISGSADQRTVMLDTFSSAPVPQHERSPADAGPVGRIAFDMFMEDKTAGKFSQMLNENPFESFPKNGMWNLLYILKWLQKLKRVSPFPLSNFLVLQCNETFSFFQASKLVLINSIL